MIVIIMLPRQLLTLAFLVRENATSMQLLLGLKKRGFGKGKWNGFGGKVEAVDASIAAAAAREVEEEAHVVVRSEDLQHCGVLLFSFESTKETMEVHVFLTHKFVGEPSESEEMKPQWYNATEIPYDHMWADDRIWLPQLLDGKSIQGHFFFAADEDTLLHYELKVTSD